MLSTGIVSNQKPISFLPPAGCDLPEQGGISGNIRKDEPYPFVLEERPTNYDFKTGKLKYSDKMESYPWVCSEGPSVCYRA